MLQFVACLMIVIYNRNLCSHPRLALGMIIICVSFTVLAFVIMIVNYDCTVFPVVSLIVQAIDWCLRAKTLLL